MKNINFLFLLLPLFSFGQSQNLNYVKTTEYKIPTLDVIPNPDPDEALVTVSYFDGLGRPIQKVSHKQAANGKDIIQHIDYDDFGRVKFDYLPHVSQGQDMTFDDSAEYNVLNYYNTSYYQNTSNPYSEKFFDGSPLNRVLKQSAPGNAWAMNSTKEIKFVYNSNHIDDNIPKFQIQRNYNTSNLVYDYSFQSFGKYQTGELHKNIIKDENWVSGKDNTTEEYTDKYGRVVLKRKYDLQVPHDTNYIYDNIGNLLYVIPPLASDEIIYDQENQVPYTFNQHIPIYDFLIPCSGSSVSGGGGLYLSIQNSNFNCYFNAGFNSAKIDVTKTFPINAIYPIPDRDLISFNGYILRVENNVLKFVNNNVNGVEPCVTSLSQQLIYPFPLEQSLFSHITTFTTTVNLDILPNLCYQYKYDSQNRLVEKKLPGKEWEYIVYDKLNRPVYSGPSLNPFTGVGIGWNIIKYDAYGRVVYTGWLPDTTINTARRKELQTNKNAESIISESKTTSNATLDGIIFQYTNSVLPTSSLKLLSINYYDTYSYPNAPTIPTSIFSQPVRTDVKGLATGSWIRVLNFNPTPAVNEFSYIMYDLKGRPIRTRSQNHLGGYSQKDVIVNFIGQPLQVNTSHKRSTNDAVVVTDEYFEYNDQGRLMNHTHRINGGSLELLSHNEYDDLGKLITKNIGGADVSSFNGYQKVNYKYNIRGWLTNINDINQLNADIGQFQDLFAFKINYETVQNTVGGMVDPLFNGNISETFWRTQGDDVVRKYGYKYDKLNRLKNAIYQKPQDINPITNSYNENLWYDKNGNITQLHRTGDLDDFNYIVNIDDLQYTYHPTKKNQLMKVYDEEPNPNGFKDDVLGTTDSTDDYEYDDFGNMISDANKQINIIYYNHLNLPIKIVFRAGGIIEYLYNSAGIKVQKKVTQGGTIATTDYQGGFQYLNGQLFFFPHAEGYVNVTNGAYFSYVFNYTDHLGNVRVSYGKDPKTGQLKILEENHYYPFGLKHKNYNVDKNQYGIINQIPQTIPVTSLDYKYKFNGKEWQDELGLNIYDYHARNFMPDIGRTLTMDPMAEKFYAFSPHSFFNNNPVYFIDPTGMTTKNHTVDQAGAKLSSTLSGRMAKYAFVLFRNLYISTHKVDEDQNSSDEPPMNLFSSEEQYNGDDKDQMRRAKANKTFNGVVRSRKYKVGDGIFSLYGHGLLELDKTFNISDQRNGYSKKKNIRDMKVLNQIMMDMSPQWKEAMENKKEIVLFLFTCGSGNDGKKSVAARFSAVFGNVTTVGGQGNFQYGAYPDGSYGIVGVTGNTLYYYKNGELIDTKPMEFYLDENNYNTKISK